MVVVFVNGVGSVESVDGGVGWRRDNRKWEMGNDADVCDVE